ncbi:hypothetical protein L5515_005136 [Caenorhabditis briggsae]|uniref:Uncharacterized protein n=1 Tax=Caenorhabditis briggsae TaxID=6238 RepID=A0AAE9END7_CAEBR|nr:hypothetical protein L5515_005136 [Caenorhabditis briggsae]
MTRVWSIILEAFSTQNERSHSTEACTANDRRCRSPVECTENDLDKFLLNVEPLSHSQEECTENDHYPKRAKDMPPMRTRSSEERCHFPVVCTDDDLVLDF